MADFVVGGQSYRSGKMDAFAQFHVTRKLGPLLAKLGPEVARMAPTAATEAGEPPLNMVDLLGRLAPMLDALQEMSETDCNYVFERCFTVVSRQQGDRWAPIWNTAAKRLQFDDISMPDMVQITFQVLGDNLASFFPAGLPSSLGPQQAAKGPLPG